MGMSDKAKTIVGSAVGTCVSICSGVLVKKLFGVYLPAEAVKIPTAAYKAGVYGVQTLVMAGVTKAVAKDVCDIFDMADGISAAVTMLNMKADGGDTDGDDPDAGQQRAEA